MPDQSSKSLAKYAHTYEQFWPDAEKYMMDTGVPPTEDLIVHAQDSTLITSDGRPILDFTSGQMSAILGHGNPEIVETAHEYMQNLDHLLSNMLTLPVVGLAKKLAEILPPQLSKSFFLSTGSESIEAAIKIAKFASGKFEIVAFTNSYHGLTQGAGGVTYSTGRKNGGPTTPGMIVFPVPNKLTSPFKTADGAYDWETEMDYAWSLVDSQSVGSLAAFILEPILSTGGIIVLPDGYLKRLQSECKKRGMLLILDEAQTGIGRTGRMFCFEGHDVVPDILCLSKTLGSGLPLASVTTSTEICERAKDAGFLWLTTHLNDPMVAAVGLKVLEIVLRDNLCVKAVQCGEVLGEGLKAIHKEFDCVVDVRGEGLMWGLELKPTAGLGQLVSDLSMRKGLSCNIIRLPNHANVMRMAPPLTTTSDQIRDGLRILRESVAEAAAQLGI